MDNTLSNYIQSIECECGETFEQNENTVLGMDVLDQFTKHVLDEHMELQQQKRNQS